MLSTQTGVAAATASLSSLSGVSQEAQDQRSRTGLSQPGFGAHHQAGGSETRPVTGGRGETLPGPSQVSARWAETAAPPARSTARWGRPGDYWAVERFAFQVAAALVVIWWWRMWGTGSRLVGAAATVAEQAGSYLYEKDPAAALHYCPARRCLWPNREGSETRWSTRGLRPRARGGPVQCGLRALLLRPAREEM
jgi:hypothetical protein